MSPGQILRELVATLKALTWSDAPAEKVFGEDVAEVVEVDGDTLLGSFPQCLVTVGNGTPDPDEPGLREQDFGVHIVADVAGDATGGRLLTGASRGGGVGSSEGKGLLELAAVVEEALRRLTGADGLPVLVEAAGMPQIAPLGDEKSIGHLTLLVRAVCTAADEYEAPRHLVVVQGAAGHATVTWKNPSSRFDFRRTIIVRKAGSTAPTSPTDGTEVYAGALLTLDDACGVGTFTWAAFAAYTWTGVAADEHYSPAGEVGSTRTKAIT